MSGAVSFGGINRGLKKYLHTLDRETVFGLQPLQHRSRITIEEIKVSNIYGESAAVVGPHFESDLLEQQSIVKHHLAFDPQQDAAVVFANRLNNVCRHKADYESGYLAVSLTAKNLQIFNFSAGDANIDRSRLPCYQKYSCKYE